MGQLVIDPGAVSPPEVLHAGFFLFSAAAKLGKLAAKGVVKGVGAAVGVVKKELGIKPKQQPAFQPSTPQQWAPGMSAPPGYRVVNAGTRSERLEAVTGDAGVSSSVAGAEQRRAQTSNFLDDALRTVRDSIGRTTADIARQTGEQIAAAAASSDVARQKERQIKTAVAIGGAALGIILIAVLFMAARPRS